MPESLKNFLKNVPNGEKIIEFQGKENQYVIIDNEAGSKLKLLRSSIVSLFDK